MSALAFLLALALPTLAGLLLWLGCVGRPRQLAAWLAALGVGHIVGQVGFGALLRLATPWPIAHWFAVIAPILGLLLGGLGVVVWRRAAPIPPSLPAVDATTAAERGLIRLLLLGLALHAWALFSQAWALPPLTWDAWTVWLAKPQAWLAQGQVLPSATFAPWWQAAPGGLIYNQAPHYPEALPRLLAWQASALGGWDHRAIALNWPLLWLALGAACYGLLRLEGLRRPVALLAGYAVLSLPLLNSHAALVGYADLWLAALLGVAVVQLGRAWRQRSRGEIAFAAICLLLLPALKLEGAIWLLCAVLALAVASLPRRARRLGLPLLALLVAGWIIGFGLHLPLPGLGWIELRWGAVLVPGLVEVTLHWRPVLGPVLESLFLLPNWMLLWPLVLGLLLAYRPAPTTRAWLRPGAWLLGLGYGFLGLLFFFTDAAQWAESLTSLNRVLLQIVPATVLWLSLRAGVRPRPYGRAS